MSQEESQQRHFEIRKERFVDKKETSGRIGETSRFIGFGLVALVFTIHGSDNSLSTNIQAHNEYVLNLSGLSGCLTILCDYLQYLCGYFSVNGALRRRESNFSYNSNTLAYKGRIVFFWLKQVFAFSGAMAVIIIFSWAIFAD
ncbi:hypothetical protein [Labrenzia sp. OB1]|uniref:hypothetical protein n=1 Tax=Labrenzia sp. OB1 TaxID=1561204 RepID=UPI0012E7A373|nr:hypothetical protein [Labrenzia sp. OB1]